LQSAAEGTFSNQDLFCTDVSLLEDLPEKPTGSIVIIENKPSPGQIKAIVGGFGKKTGNFVLNRAVSAYRQPGSSIKPLDVYAPAIDTGKITPASVFTDMELFYNPEEPLKPYPKNSYSGFKGNMNVRWAITISCNTIAAQVWKNMLGGETSLEYLKRVGIDRSGENYVSIALGGFNKGMTTLEMTGAYATFANHGLYTEPYAYTKVIDADGNVLLENRPEFTQVYKPETAFIMADIMKDVLRSGGTANGFGVEGMPTAGKTGTTDENRDKWFCGFTPYYTAAVWYGYDNRLGQTKILDGDKRNATRIWQDVMNKIHAGLESVDFEMPSSVLKIKICKDSGMKAGEFCPKESLTSEYFLPGAIMNPTAECTLHTPEPTPTPIPTPIPTPVPTETTTAETTAAGNNGNGNGNGN
jgi:penicillin-binding protein 1A